MRLLNSTVFQMCVIILALGGLITYNSAEVTWLQWFDKAMEAVFAYMAKESVRYGSEAYQGKSDVS